MDDRSFEIKRGVMECAGAGAVQVFSRTPYRQQDLNLHNRLMTPTAGFGCVQKS